MRIGLFHNLPSGGAKRHTFEQVRELARRGHSIVEFAPSTADLSFCSLAPYAQQRLFSWPPSRYLSRRIPLLTPYIHALQGINTLRRIEQLSAAIAREMDDGNFDLVFAKDCQIAMNPYVLRYLRTPSFFQCHHGLRHHVEQLNTTSQRSSVVQSLQSVYYGPARILYQRKFTCDETRNAQSATRVLTNAVFSQRLLAYHYRVRSLVIYPGINTDLFRHHSLEKLNYILCVGSLIYSKGYRFLISALARIPTHYRPRLFIAANSVDTEEEQTVRNMAAISGVDLHIERITRDERLVQVYNQAQVFVYAPLQEALGMAPLEAMACGTPVVAVKEGGMQETVLDGVTGYLVERDVDIFAQTLISLLGNPALQTQMGQDGISYVRKQWTWQQAVDKLERVFTLESSS